MEIQIQDLGKRFINDWIFRFLNLSLSEGEAYAIVGPNGSGKSTFLQIISGIQPATEGTIRYLHQQQSILPENIFRHLSLAAPYQELIEEMTLAELIKFHLNFRKFYNDISVKDFLEKIKLSHARNKPIQFFSSGMKQRLKLGLAFFSESSLLLLDEPTSNLDKEGFRWYEEQILQNLHHRLTLIASNQSAEYDFFCKNIISIKSTVNQVS
jgi:ABC-type multidrug transport system ATPase subunit